MVNTVDTRLGYTCDIPVISRELVSHSLFAFNIIWYLFLDGNDSDDWDFLVGCYFCFVTLSTIGFGDYVPGTRHVTADDGQEKLVLCAFYLLIGLALQAMCFQLIQEDVRRAVRSLGVRLGLVRRDETN